MNSAFTTDVELAFKRPVESLLQYRDQEAKMSKANQVQIAVIGKNRQCSLHRPSLCILPIPLTTKSREYLF